MKKLLFLIFAFVGIQLTAQDPAVVPDSLNRELDEITVKTAPVVRKVDRSIYSVEQHLKERSTSTLNLLRNLQIPQLTVNDVMETVTSSLGTVQIRINGREVSIDKLKTLDRENIQKIEWIDNPGLRYGTEVGAVINIIVKNPTAGGSFMANILQSLTMGFTNASTSLTLNSGASQWTIGGWFNSRNRLDMFREYTDSYSLPDGSLLQRSQSPLDSYFTNRNACPTVSYNYMKSDSINLYVGLYFSDQWRGEGEYNGLLESDLSRSGQFTHLTEGWKLTYKYPWMEVYFERKLKKGNTLVVNASAQWTDQTSGNYYRESEYPEGRSIVDIDNTIQSRTWNYGVEGNYIKEFGKAGQLTAGVRYNGSKSHSTYLDYDNYLLIRTANRLYFFSEYMATVKKVTLTAGLGGLWNQYYLGSHQDLESTFNFVPRLSVNWRASDRSRWSVTYSSGVSSPTSSQLSPVTQEIDGIQIERGDPELKSYSNHLINFRYNFSNNKNFNLSASVNYNHMSNPVMTYYTWEGDKILRSYSNSGYYNSIYGSIDLSYEPVENWLSFSASIIYTRDWDKGLGFSHRLTSWGQNFNVTLTHWNWTLDFQIYNPRKDLWGQSISKGEFFNMASLSYHWKNWNFGAGIFMPFGRYNNSDEVIANLVKQKTINRTNKIERMPFINISYNVNWGHQKRAADRRIGGSASDGGGAQAASR